MKRLSRLRHARSRRTAAGIGIALLTTALTCLAVPAASAATPGQYARTPTAVRAIAFVSLTLDNPGTQGDQVADKVALQMVAHGGTPPYSWTAFGLPPNLHINATTGEITGRAGGPPNNYHPEVTVTDSAGHSASVIFTWTVVLI